MFCEPPLTKEQPSSTAAVAYSSEGDTWLGRYGEMQGDVGRYLRRVQQRGRHLVSKASHNPHPTPKPNPNPNPNPNLAETLPLSQVTFALARERLSGKLVAVAAKAHLGPATLTLTRTLTVTRRTSPPEPSPSPYPSPYPYPYPYP